MAPISRLAAGPISIITGALFGALAPPTSSPPPAGVNATVWGTDYRGTASFLDLSLESVPFPVAPATNSSKKSTKKTSKVAITLPPSSSFVYYNSTADTFTGCNNKIFTWDDTVVFMNPLQFGDMKADNSTCGEWIEIKNRENMARTAIAQIVGVCNDCEYGSFSLTRGGLEGLAPDVPFDEMVFDKQSTLTIDELLHGGGEDPLPTSTPVSPKDLLNVEWTLTDAPEKEEPEPIKPTTTTAVPTTTTSTKTSTTAPTPTPTKKPDEPEEGGKMFTGRATWFSDNSGQCEHKFSQGDLIVAVNESQMGKNKKLCGKKILLTKEGSDVKVVVTVVDMCPSKYCKFGQLDISRAAFQKFASLDKGIMNLKWKFLD